MITITSAAYPSGGAALPVTKYTLSNGALSVDILNLGGTVAALRMPGRDGSVADVCLGFENAQDYLTLNSYFGALIGRYANRIARGRFLLNGREYALACNNGRNHLHGGLAGFDKRLWEVRQEADGLLLSLDSPDGEEGYPGNLKVQVRYRLTTENELWIEYAAQSDADTILNLTNHSYWNLKGVGQGDVLDHTLQVNASRFTRVDGEAIPTGELPGVAGTPLDFRTPRRIGERIAEQDPDLKAVGGYDHNFVLDGSGFREAAVLSEEDSGRTLTVLTDQPGIQVYTGNMLNGSLAGKNVRYGKHAGVALETQCFPDTPNHPEFPSCVLRAGESYKQTTCFRFSW